MKRRNLLVTIGGIGLTGLAGCASEEERIQRDYDSRTDYARSSAEAATWLGVGESTSFLNGERDFKVTVTAVHDSTINLKVTAITEYGSRITYTRNEVSVGDYVDISEHCDVAVLGKCGDSALVVIDDYYKQERVNDAMLLDVDCENAN